jgi:DNA-binding SARP family transcriptional activator
MEEVVAELVEVGRAVFGAMQVDGPGDQLRHLRYEILGPLRVRDEHGVAPINARKMQILLAVLIIRANEMVSIDQLTVEIWGQNSPRRPSAALHVYISQLRKLLGRSGGTANPIVTRPPGYLLSAAPQELDLHLFGQLVQLGRTHAKEERHEQAVDCFDAALRLWRGPAMSTLRDSPTVNAFATWLEEIRLQCAEMLVESNMALGRHRDLVGFLYALTVEHPLREGFYRQLMLALYRAERQADALKVYRSARDTLRNELGLEPGRALRELQRAILLADDRLELGRAS